MTTETAVHHFIAVPANPQAVSEIYGIGKTPEAAVEDAWIGANCGTARPRVEQQEPDHDGREFVAYNVTGEEIGWFHDEADAQEAADLTGFSAHKCTSRLYQHVKEHGGMDISWTRNDSGLYDLSDEEDEEDA